MEKHKCVYIYPYIQWITGQVIEFNRSVQSPTEPPRSGLGGCNWQGDQLLNGNLSYILLLTGEGQS